MGADTVPGRLFAKHTFEWGEDTAGFNLRDGVHYLMCAIHVNYIN